MMPGRRCSAVALALCGLAAAASAPAADAAADSAAGYDPAEANFPGVGNMRRAWEHWTLNCQGCHRADGTGSQGAAPSLAGTVAKFLHADGGREYLGQVPGVASSPLSSADLAEVMNWMLWRFDRGHIPPGFHPYTTGEVDRLRATPLHLEASRLREQLLQQADRHLKE